MLSMTRSAAGVLDTVRTRLGVPESFVARRFPNLTNNGVEIDITFTPESDPADQVVEVEGTTLWCDQDLAETLTDTLSIPSKRRRARRWSFGIDAGPCDTVCDAAISVA